MELPELIRLHDARLERMTATAIGPRTGCRSPRIRRSPLPLLAAWAVVLILFAAGSWMLLRRLDARLPSRELSPEARLSQPFMAARGPGLPAAYMEVLQWAD